MGWLAVKVSGKIPAKAWSKLFQTWHGEKGIKLGIKMLKLRGNDILESNQKRTKWLKTDGFDLTIQEQGSLLFNSLPEAREVRFLIHIYNHLLHNCKLDSKSKTLASLLPGRRILRSYPTQWCHTYTGHYACDHHHLRSAVSEHSVLAKCLNFVPLERVELPASGEFSMRSFLIL